MSEMLERAARALRTKVLNRPDDGSPIVGDGEDGLDVVRVVVEAMREPTPTVLFALEDLLDYPGTDRTREQMWAGLIDAALK